MISVNRKFTEATVLNTGNVIKLFEDFDKICSESENANFMDNLFHVNSMYINRKFNSISMSLPMKLKC